MDNYKLIFDEYTVNVKAVNLKDAIKYFDDILDVYNLHDKKHRFYKANKKDMLKHVFGIYN